MVDVTPDPIMRIALGFMAAKHLFVASAVGLFEALNGGPATLDELASKCGVPRRTLGISADAMASLGLVERDGDRYRNSAVAEAFLAGASGPDLRPMLRFWDRISYPAWLRLEATIRSGEGQSIFDRLPEEEQRIFSAGVEAFTAGAAAALGSAYDFSSHRQVLDIAGGTGSFLIAILRRYPTLHGTLFELPGACAVARERLAREPEGARVAVVEDQHRCAAFVRVFVHFTLEFRLDRKRHLKRRTARDQARARKCRTAVRHHHGVLRPGIQ